ncbi:MAG: type II toxin-antitoxin system RelE/ParE family toxin [Bacteroidales bacterium]|jgi:toxin ParE1/3/4|nr:type II toxin-antitoxin system RelE/ParE family toxin [Bacteroidales bacterium]
MKFKISILASRDIENIWLYTYENWSIEQADRYLNLIIDEIEYVAEKPESGFDVSSVRQGYFRTKIKSHLIFYKIDQKNEIVEIIRILHQSMDIENRLSE